LKNFILIFLCCFLESSCATLTRGSSQDYTIETNPPGAYIQTSHGYFCVSPCKLSLPRNKNFTVTADLNGYLPKVASVSNNSGGGGVGISAGNILIGGVIGLGTDATSGALKDLYPNPLIINLVRELKVDEKKLINKKKDKDMNVIYAQEILTELFYYKGPINGIFTEELKVSLEDFLSDEGLLNNSSGYYNEVIWIKNYNLLEIIKSKFFKKTLNDAILRKQE